VFVAASLVALKERCQVLAALATSRLSQLELNFPHIHGEVLPKAERHVLRRDILHFKARRSLATSWRLGLAGTYFES
jgi:hypothetical protein